MTSATSTVATRAIWTRWRRTSSWSASWVSSNVEEGGIADVSVYKDYAYLAAWGGQTCKHNGVHVVDISDVAAPEEVAFIPAKEGSAPGEGVQALSISTPAFTGDILVSNNETCKAGVGFGGMNIYDVTVPSAPEHLAVGFGDYTVGSNRKKTANDIHSVFAWDAGDKAYAVMVDNEEAADVDIVDITNPRKPKLIAEYDLAALFPQILQPNQGLDSVFHHDMVVKEINGRYIMLVSYWDGGYVQLDVTNPAAATFIVDSDFTNPDPEAAESGLNVRPEGNAHQSEFTLDNSYVIAADEDFGPYALNAANLDDATEINASSGSDTPQLEEGQSLTGESVFVGRACPGDPAVPAGDGTPDRRRRARSVHLHREGGGGGCSRRLRGHADLQPHGVGRLQRHAGHDHRRRDPGLRGRSARAGFRDLRRRGPVRQRGLPRR